MSRSKKPRDFRHIAVVRLSALGDILHTIPTVQSIQRHYPNAQITWFVKPEGKALVERLPGVEVVVYDQGITNSVEDIWRQFEGVCFDIVLACHTNIYASTLIYGLKSPTVLGFTDKRVTHKQDLFVNDQCADRNSYHVLDTIGDFAHHLGAPFDEPSWDIQFTEEELSLAKSFTRDMDVVVCAPSASSSERNWDIDAFALILDYLDRCGFHVAIVGGKEKLEMQRAHYLWKKGKGRYTNFTGTLTVPESLALMRHSKLFVGVDTGPLHMARSQGLPIVGLYAHSNPRRTGPYGQLEGVVDVYTRCVEEEFGKPECEVPWATRLYGEHYMDYITPAMVKEKLDPFIGKIKPGLREQQKQKMLASTLTPEEFKREYYNVWTVTK